MACSGGLVADRGSTGVLCYIISQWRCIWV